MTCCNSPDGPCPRDPRLFPRRRAHNLVGQTARLAVVNGGDGRPGVHLHRLHAEHPPELPMEFRLVTPVGLAVLECLGLAGCDPEGRLALGYDIGALRGRPGTLFVAGPATDGRLYRGEVVTAEDAGKLSLGGAGTEQFCCRRLSPEGFLARALAQRAAGVEASALDPRVVCNAAKASGPAGAGVSLGVTTSTPTPGHQDPAAASALMACASVLQAVADLLR